MGLLYVINVTDNSIYNAAAETKCGDPERGSDSPNLRETVRSIGGIPIR